MYKLTLPQGSQLKLPTDTFNTEAGAQRHKENLIKYSKQYISMAKKDVESGVPYTRKKSVAEMEADLKDLEAIKIEKI